MTASEPPAGGTHDAPGDVIIAPAKLTVSLHVVGTRADGYHLLDAEMVSINLADRLQIVDTTHEAETSISVTGPYARGVPVDRSNLVHQALELVGRKASVSIDKQIPHGGGLGGGSSDAAAILRWADYRDRNAASRLGADIAFCIDGGRARVTGIGEIVTRLPDRHQTFTLVIPPLNVSTPEVYAAYDTLARDPSATVVNDLEPAAIMVVPELAAVRDRVIDVTGERPQLAGSGATWFLVGRHGNALAAMGNEGVSVVEVETVGGAASHTLR